MNGTRTLTELEERITELRDRTAGMHLALEAECDRMDRNWRRALDTLEEARHARLSRASAGTVCALLRVAATYRETVALYAMRTRNIEADLARLGRLLMRVRTELDARTCPVTMVADCEQPCCYTFTRDVINGVTCTCTTDDNAWHWGTCAIAASFGVAPYEPIGK